MATSLFGTAALLDELAASVNKATDVCNEITSAAVQCHLSAKALLSSSRRAARVHLFHGRCCINMARAKAEMLSAELRTA